MLKKDKMYLNLVELLFQSGPFLITFGVPAFLHLSIKPGMKKYKLHKKFKAKENAKVALPPKIKNYIQVLIKKEYLV